MLRGISPLLTPDLLAVLAKMGHGDELAVVDRNYPAYAAGRPVTHLVGVDTTVAMAAILELLPLDTFVEHPLMYMAEVGGNGSRLPVHEAVRQTVRRIEGREVPMGPLERHAFYERVARCHAVVATTEDRPYGCFILVKGVIAATNL